MSKHFLTLQDYSTTEIKHLIKKSIQIKSLVKSGQKSPRSLESKTLGLIFSKRSTRTRISSETGWAWYGGNSLFLGNDDIQLGAGEPMKDTARVVSSFVDCIMARLGPHSDILELAKHSKVPVINALTDSFHPLQALADLMTLVEAFNDKPSISEDVTIPSIHVAWVGDANNVLNSLVSCLPRLGIKMSVATPMTHSVSNEIKKFAELSPVQVKWIHSPLEAVKDADVIITDTWISMGMESEKRQRLKDFEGFQVHFLLSSYTY